MTTKEFILDVSKPFGWVRMTGPDYDEMVLDRIVPGLQAESCGIEAGSRILAINDMPVRTGAELGAAMAPIKAAGKQAGGGSYLYKVLLGSPQS